MQAYDLPRVAVIALAKRAEEVFVPGRPTRSSSIQDRPASSSCSASATRRTASRSGSTDSGATLRRESRSSTHCRRSVRAQARAHPAFRSPERLLAASSEELEGVPGVPAKTGREIYAALHKAGGA